MLLDSLELGMACGPFTPSNLFLNSEQITLSLMWTWSFSKEVWQCGVCVEELFLKTRQKCQLVKNMAPPVYLLVLKMNV